MRDAASYAIVSLETSGQVSDASDVERGIAATEDVDVRHISTIVGSTLIITESRKNREGRRAASMTSGLPRASQMEAASLPAAFVSAASTVEHRFSPGRSS